MAERPLNKIILDGLKELNEKGICDPTIRWSAHYGVKRNSWRCKDNNEEVVEYIYPENNLLRFLQLAKFPTLRAACKQNGLKVFIYCKTRKDLIRMLMSL